MYEACLTRIADEVHRRGRSNVSVMVASHNEGTVRFAVNLMKERCIAPSERVICMAQLYGMCDQVFLSYPELLVTLRTNCRFPSHWDKLASLFTSIYLMDRLRKFSHILAEELWKMEVF